MERFWTTIRCRLTSSLILLFRDAPLLRAGNEPNPPTTHSMCDCNGSHHHVQQAWNTWTSLTRPHSEALCSLSICLTTAQTDSQTGQFRCNPYLPQGSEFDENDISAVDPFTAIFYFVLLFFVSLLFYDEAFMILSLRVVITI